MEKMIFLNSTLRVGVGCFLLNLVELHYLNGVFTSQPLFVACPAAANSEVGLSILPCSALMRTGLGSRCPPAGECLGSADPQNSALQAPCTVVRGAGSA